jgi:antitoxin (DNA-binding transcriptional repressor) of toxin-antitoxin stability system
MVVTDAPNVLSVTDLAEQLEDFLNRVAAGERAAIERDGEVIAEILPLEKKRGITWGEFIDTYPDRPRPDDRFADDLEAIQAEQPLISVDPVWPD